MENESKIQGDAGMINHNTVATVATDGPPPIKLNRAERRRLMKKFGTFGRIARIGRIKV